MTRILIVLSLALLVGSLSLHAKGKPAPTPYPTLNVTYYTKLTAIQGVTVTASTRVTKAEFDKLLKRVERLESLVGLTYSARSK